MTEAEFTHEVLRLFAQADIRDELFWTVTDEKIIFFAIVSDVFDWGSADCEEITQESLPLFRQAYDDLVALYRAGQVKSDPTHYTAVLFASRMRGLRPQGAAYPKERALQALLNACGPERERGLLNPRSIPKPVED
jgi:hypothetical protein